MNNEPKPDISSLGIKAETEVECKQNGLMEWVKSDATTIGVIYRVGKQMIEIDQHGSDHY